MSRKRGPSRAMRTLLMRVNKHLEGDELPGSIYAELSGTAIDQPRRFMIPVGSGFRWHEEPVVPGEFLLQVRFPSGVVLSEDVRVAPGGEEPVQVVVRPEQSAREHLSWPGLL